MKENIIIIFGHIDDIKYVFSFFFMSGEKLILTEIHTLCINSHEQTPSLSLNLILKCSL